MLRFFLLAMLCVPLSGCFLSDSPAISPSSAENVGSRLQYVMYDPNTQHGQVRDIVRLKRWKGNQYQLYLSEGDGSQESEIPYKSWLIRRFGTRNQEPIFLIQFAEPEDASWEAQHRDIGASFMFFPVVVGANGVGVVGAVDCTDQRIKSVARAHGIKLVCTDNGDEPFKFPRIANKVSEEQIWLFLVEMLKRNLFKWEDTDRFSAFHWQF